MGRSDDVLSASIFAWRRDARPSHVIRPFGGDIRQIGVDNAFIFNE